MRKIATAEALQIYDQHTKGTLTLPALFHTLMKLQTDAYAEGIHEASKPIQAISQDIDRRMALMDLDGLSENLSA